jgi:hypothetical protein
MTISAPAMLSGEYEFHLLHNRLWITSECDPNEQLELTVREAYDLWRYLERFHGSLFQAVHRADIAAFKAECDEETDPP